MAGQQLTVATSGDLDTVLVLYDAAGTIVATDDDGGPGLLSLLDFTVPAGGDYYLMVAGYGLGTALPADPFDSGSGLGAGKEGTYGLDARLVFPDRDFYAVDLVAGDVLGASVNGLGTRLTVRDPAGRVVLGSEQDASFIYAPNAPLPGGGNAVLSYVTPRNGRYTLEVGGGSSGQYDVTLEAYRPGPEALPQGTTQTLFLDFDGARINTAIFGGPGVRTLSPLQGFLGMDAGGAFPGLFGVGPDNIGGTADDVDYDYGEDVYTPDEGFAGVEDTLDTTAWALVKGTAK